MYKENSQSQLKVAIQPRKNSFSQEWINYCRLNNIYYEEVDLWANDAIEKLRNFDLLLVHFHHSDSISMEVAKNLIFALEKTGLTVFPNYNTCMHFDDKVTQKYLLEAIAAPLITSNVFYDKRKAKNFIKSKEHPIVFKLKGGAGASNVKLLRDYKDSIKYVNQAFSSGFPKVDRVSIFKDCLKACLRKFNTKNFFSLIKSAGRLLLRTDIERKTVDGYGYFYCQSFIPENDSDIRVIIIGDKAFGIKRYVREGDFRASGSGNISYEPSDIPAECIDIAFDVTKKLGAQCLSFDFVYFNSKPLIVEISYGFSKDVYRPCKGYWNRDKKWFAVKFIAEHFIIEELIKEVQNSNE